jgi:hypothetical protein
MRLISETQENLTPRREENLTPRREEDLTPRRKDAKVKNFVYFELSTGRA